MERASARVSTALLLLHAALAVAVVLVAAEPLRGLLRSVREPVTFAGEEVSAIWLAPLLFAFGFLIARLTMFARGRRAPVSWTIALFVALASTIAARVLEPDAQIVGYTNLQGAPPTLQTVSALQALQARIAKSLAANGQVPELAALQQPIVVDGQELIPGYRYRGARRPFQIVRVDGADGAVLRDRPGDLPGTIYVAVSPDGRRYWLTALVLLDDHGARSTEILPGPHGDYVLTNSDR